MTFGKLNHATYGFGTVNITGTNEITDSGTGSLVGLPVTGCVSDGCRPDQFGGTLNLITPLLTGGAGFVMSYMAGGSVNLLPPAGVAPNAAAAGGVAVGLGSEIDITGASVNDATPFCCRRGG